MKNKNFLISSLDDFEINKVFISSLLNTLWNFPEAMYNILINTKPDILKKNLAPFILNNFYCNYLSGNYMENNLLYIIALMLKDEVDGLRDVNEYNSFLENTNCGILLEELIKMPDIQIYFKNIIFNIVENMERIYSFKEINFNVTEILKEFNKIKDAEDKKVNKNKEKDLDEKYKKIIDSKILDIKYKLFKRRKYVP